MRPRETLGPQPEALPSAKFPRDMEKAQETLQAWKGRVEQELDRVMAFWLEHSHDHEHGGFFSCLGRGGQLYDDLKYVWLQGRQVWMYCHLYRKLERFRRPELLEAAKAGVCPKPRWPNEPAPRPRHG